MSRIIDLTFPIHEGMTTFPAPWHPFVEITQLGRHGLEGRETRKIVIGSHTGTHCDAPRHFIPGGATIDEIPLDVFIGPAVVCDLSGAPASQAITVRCGMLRSQVIWRLANWRVAAMPFSITSLSKVGLLRSCPASSASQTWR